MNRKIEISPTTILLLPGLLILLWVLYLIKDIILLLFVSFIFVSALSPLVDRLVSYKIPKTLSVIIIVLSLIFILIALVTLVLRPLIAQTGSLFQTLSDAITHLTQENFVDQSIIQDELSNFSRRLVSFVLGFFENFITFVSVLVITFYLLLDKHKIEELFTSLFVGQKQRVSNLLNKIEEKLGAWMRGQLVLSLIVGVMYYIGLSILGVEFALPLAIFGALLEVIPVIGPIVSAIPAVLIALTVSPLLAGLVAGLYFAIQQVEAQIIIPQVMRRAVGLNPILVILAVAVGGRLLGIGGALLAVPIAVVIQVILEDFLGDKKAA